MNRVILYIKIILLSLSGVAYGQEIDFAQLSEDFISNIKSNVPTQQIESYWKSVSIQELKNSLDTDEKKLVFWINIYNGYIQKILGDQPELYKNRSSFFKEKRIPIIGRKLSFADIEHGMIRKSQIEYFFGYIRNPLAPRYERQLRVEQIDPRIHFALNCGAKDCPPIAIYKVGKYDEQINYVVRNYLKRVTDFSPSTSIAKTSSLFSWFRGDFGGKEGIIKMLEDYEIVPRNEVKKITFKAYNWALSLGNYIDTDYALKQKKGV